MVATSGGNLAIAQLLLKCGANVSAATNDGDTLLHRAPEAGLTDIARLLHRLLHEYGADIGLMTTSVVTPHCMACEHDHVDTISVLLEYGVLTVDNGAELLRLVAGDDYVDVTRALIDYGATVDGVLHGDSVGETALYQAIKGGKCDTGEFLLRSGSDIGITTLYDSTPLHKACAHDEYDIAHVLLEHGSDVSSVAFDGRTPLFVAVSAASGDLVLLLIEHGAVIDHEDDKGDIALSAGLQYAHQDFCSFARVLVFEGGANVNHTGTGSKMMPLYIILKYYGLHGDDVHLDYARYLLQCGADSNMTTTRRGSTPLHAAAKDGALLAVQALLAAGATIDVVNHAGETPLALAKMHDHTDVVQALIKAGASGM